MSSLARVLVSFLLLFTACLDGGVLAYTLLSDETLKNLPPAGADFDIHNGALLAPLLIPRVPGTPGSKAAQQHLVDFFSTHLPKWTIEYHNSTSKTPVTGDREVPFVNLIMTRDPPWTQPGSVGRLNLVAHYDSKITPEGFVGATDSAAPCAMLLHAVRSIDEALTRRWATMESGGAGNGLEEEQGLQVIFLDGEEAFLTWTDEDSLYGARYVLPTMRFRIYY
jgi:glutaminyl-peptide cyclotransferase